MMTQNTLGMRILRKSTDWFVHDVDSPENVRIKRTFGPVVMLVFWMDVFYVLTGWQGVDGFFAVVDGILCCLASVIFLVKARAGGDMKRTLDVTLVLYSTGILCTDLEWAAILNMRAWSIVVLVLDAGLVYERPGAIIFVIIQVFAYLILERSEAAVRWGLYSAVTKDGTVVAPCDCSNPPCSIGMAVDTGSAAVIFTVLTDFWLTRGFSNDVRRQIRRVNASVDVAAEVAAALARYDVRAAQEAIDRLEDLPDELVNSYLRLLSNLNSYKAFLPDALLYGDDAEDVRDLPPPGAGAEGEVNVGLIFTDIQSSTSLWEVCPQGMTEALRTHNTVLREVALLHNGYEVKVIGDALMLAFNSAVDAVGFGIRAQSSLVECEWPEDLSDHPLCVPVFSEQGILWNGPRVRIGINFGPVRAELNHVTKRWDYFGGTVNVAARVEGALKSGGLTGITKAVMDELGPDFMHREDLLVADSGPQTLKGVSHPVRIFVVLPPELKLRWVGVHASPGTPMQVL
eukprot:Hpha_TRINITY_DN29788_c0_g1::TRINITY_DN29788_c0_g1_i1::g.2500::m.2500